MKIKKYKSLKAQAWYVVAEWAEQDATAGAGPLHKHILEVVVPSLRRRADIIERNARIIKAYKHKLGRPPARAREILKLNTNGRWVKDDGKPGVAFSYQAYSSKDQGYPAAIAENCDCKKPYTCPMRRAMDKTCERWGAANGHYFDEKRISPSKQ